MSTHSFICKEKADHTYTGIYCHWDGYPSYNGRMLVKHYNTPQSVDALLALGDLSSLGPRLAPKKGQKHTFDTPADGVCVAYHRDRGEEYCPPSQIAIWEFQNSDCEYMYVFGLDHKWRYFKKIYNPDETDPVPEIKTFTEDWAEGYYGAPITFDTILDGIPEGTESN